MGKEEISFTETLVTKCNSLINEGDVVLCLKPKRICGYNETEFCYIEKVN